MHTVCLSLVRMFGAIGFTTFALGTMYAGNALFGLGIDLEAGWGALGAKGWLLLIVSAIIGLFGMLVGWGVAIKVRVENFGTEFIITIAWHYACCGFLLWLGLASIALNVLYGKEGAVALLNNYGMKQATLELILIGVGGSLLMAFWLLFIGSISYRRVFSLDAIGYAFPVGGLMGYLQFQLLGIDSIGWLVIGLLQALILVPFATFMVMRDFYQKSELNRGM